MYYHKHIPWDHWTITEHVVLYILGYIILLKKKTQDEWCFLFQYSVLWWLGVRCRFVRYLLAQLALFVFGSNNCGLPLVRTCTFVLCTCCYLYMQEICTHSILADDIPQSKCCFHFLIDIGQKHWSTYGSVKYIVLYHINMNILPKLCSRQ